MTSARRHRISLLPDRSGYWFAGREVIGFVETDDLTTEERRRIAKWCQRFMPEALSDAQRELIARGISQEQDESRTAAAYNRDLLLQPRYQEAWEELSEDEQSRVRWPDRYVAGAKYPLSTTQLAALIRATPAQVRGWADSGLIPSRRRGSHRGFSEASVIAALGVRVHALAQPQRQLISGMEREAVPWLQAFIHWLRFSETASTANVDELLERISREIQQLQRRERSDAPLPRAETGIEGGTGYVSVWIDPIPRGADPDEPDFRIVTRRLPDGTLNVEWRDPADDPNSARREVSFHSRNRAID